MNKIRILIVDDHPMMRDALKIAFSSEKKLDVIGEAHSGAEAVKMANSLAPDLILMDLMLPDMSGIEATEKILAFNSNARVMILSSLEDEEHILAAVHAGALGYFPKTAPRTYLLEAIQKVVDGIPYMPAGITLKLFNGLRKTPAGISAAEPQITITGRQRELLLLMAEGKTDEEIASMLNLQESTVRSHIYQIQQRLGVEGRSQLVAYVHKNMLFKGSQKDSLL